MTSKCSEHRSIQWAFSKIEVFFIPIAFLIFNAKLFANKVILLPSTDIHVAKVHYNGEWAKWQKKESALGIKSPAERTHTLRKFGG